MTTPILNDQMPDAELWQLVRQGSKAAYEAVVRRHQSLVCAVAYNACGDLALSEDVAQEAFWAAWRERASLSDPGRLRAWLCGIARNLGHNARRRTARAAESAPLDAAADVPAAEPGPLEKVITREEEALVWQTLENLPELYREPLILFYREEQSVAGVAAALDLSAEAVKQRLSRGRGMLQERLAHLVEETLRRSRPGQAFTVAVVSGLATLSAGTSTALAGAAAASGTAVKAAGAAISGGLLGAVVGPLVGLFGGWLGTWLPAQLAPTRPEREYRQRIGRRMLLVAIVFCIVLAGLILALFEGMPVAYFLIGWAAWFVAFGIYVTVESVRAARAVQRLRAAAPAAEPNDTPLRRRLDQVVSRFRGRVYRSRVTLFGLPLIDINVSDPGQPGQADRSSPERRVARGWIAIGNDARGVLLALGDVAWGFIAIGGRSVGVLSFGGLAVGVVAFGGLALGVLALGGVGVGVLALGGLGIGWQAAGGGAIAWDVACGGGAMAWHAAYGGGAVAHDFAVGGAAWAEHANDDTARAVLFDHPLKRGMDWYAAYNGLITGAIVGLSSLMPWAMLLLMYRRERCP